MGEVKVADGGDWGAVEDATGAVERKRCILIHVICSGMSM